MISFPPVLPNALSYEIVFIGILAVVLVLVTLLPILRRLYFAAVLLPIGYAELYVVYHTGYATPPEIYGIPFAIMASGIIIPFFQLTRGLLSKKVGKILLILSGCVELALGAISLLNIDVIGGFYDNLFILVDFNWELVIIGTILATIGTYSLAVGTFLFLIKPKLGSLPKENSG